MAMSPAQRHYARMSAAAAAVETAARTSGSRPAQHSAAASEYELQRARLGVDLRRLREIQSVEKKIELKHELIPAYVDWVAGVLAADSGAQDDILIQVMIWLFDVGDWVRAIDLARYVLRHSLPLPDRFKSTPATFVVDTAADAAAKARGLAEEFPLQMLLEVEELTSDADMPDQAKAKLCKEIGLLIVKAAEAVDPGADGPAGMRKAGIERGLAYLRRAYGLSHLVGVKKDLDRLERELGKLNTEAAAAELANGGGREP